MAWQARINLVSTATLSEVWTRHIVDSLQLQHAAGEWQSWVDIGSGAGFPGLVVAIAAQDQPGRQVYLVESNYKRCAFLREAARETGACATVIAKKIEDALPELPASVDIVSARAVAPLRDLLAMAFPLLKNGGLGVFPKGQDVESELTEASKYWRFSHQVLVSLTNPAARIVVVTALEPSRDMPG